MTRYGIEVCNNCNECQWRNDDFFCQFDPETLKAFDSIAFTNVYPDGSVLYAEGEMPQGLFILCYGQAKLTISAAGSGKTLIKKILQPGEALGLSSVLSGNPYKATAETVRPSQLKFVKRDDFLRFYGEHRE